MTKLGDQDVIDAQDSPSQKFYPVVMILELTGKISNKKNFNRRSPKPDLSGGDSITTR